MRKKIIQYIYLIAVFTLLISCQKEDITTKTDFTQIKLSSDDVSFELASEVALNFSFGTKSNIKDERLKSASSDFSFEGAEIDEIIVAPSENGSPSLYFVNFIPKGYVIISGTKKESPVLGYSENSTFKLDSVPIAIAFWIADRMDKIQIVRNIEDYQIPDNIELEWTYQNKPPDVLHPDDVYDPDTPGDSGNSDGSNGAEGVDGGIELIQKGPLLATTWGQWWGYNSLLDRIDGSLPPTGCVATAMAQVMKYHQYPSNYNWSLMPNTYGTNETAQLMRDIGDAVSMNYTLDGSGADMSDARNALVNDFGYSSSASYVGYSVNTVVTEIMNNRPVIMDGYHTYYKTTSGMWPFKPTTHHYEDGHAWVCDGYRRHEYCTIFYYGTPNEFREYEYGPYYLHMNWGWSNSGMGSVDNDGWFKCDDWEIDGSNFSDGNPRNYQFKKKCIVNIEP